MPAIRFTLPYDADKADILKKEATRRNRSFSSYIQALFADHLRKIKPTAKRKRTRKK